MSWRLKNLAYTVLAVTVKHASPWMIVRFLSTKIHDATQSLHIAKTGKVFMNAPRKAMRPPLFFYGAALAVVPYFRSRFYAFSFNGLDRMSQFLGNSRKKLIKNLIFLLRLTQQSPLHMLCEISNDFRHRPKKKNIDDVTRRDGTRQRTAWNIASDCSRLSDAFFGANDAP